MKKFLITILTGCLLLPGILVQAQQTKSSDKEPKSVFKMNLSSIALNHYSFQYEYVLKARQSVCLGFGFSPNVSLPFKNTLSDAFGDNEDAATAIESTKFSKITITPEYRFYMGRHNAPRGFYLGLFARYSSMKLSQDYSFTPSSGNKHHAHLDGKITGFGAGVLVGTQFLLGKQQRVSIDLWLAGPFIGGMNGSFHGIDPNMDELSAEDRADLKNDIEGFDIPLWKVEATIGDDTIDAKLKGAFFGVRILGFCLGYRF